MKSREPEKKHMPTSAATILKKMLGDRETSLFCSGLTKSDRCVNNTNALIRAKAASKLGLVVKPEALYVPPSLNDTNYIPPEEYPEHLKRAEAIVATNSSIKLYR